jgi:RNA polymerase sigma-70 factor (ECF subfamily)
VQPARRTPRQIARPLPPTPRLRYERLSDAILVKRAKDGDARALEALCERHAPKVERTCRHLLGDSEDARDAGQEALAKLCVRLAQFRGESMFTTWLHRLVVNTCRDVVERRRSRMWEPLADDEHAATDGDPAHAADLADLRATLGRCLADLPGAQARVVVLKDAYGLSFEEISTADGMPVGTAKCYAHRARGRLRAQLEALGARVA